MADVEWEEETGAGKRALHCWRSSGYRADILVEGRRVSGRLWKPQEGRDAFSTVPEEVSPGEVEPAVERLKADIAAYLDELESGHS